MSLLKGNAHSYAFVLLAALGNCFSQTTGIASGSIYTLVSKANGKVLDVSNASMVNGGAVGIWTDTKSDAQRWTLTSTGGALYTLTNVGSGRLLHLANAAPAAGVAVNQNANTNDNTVKWALVDAGGGAYQIQAAGNQGFSLEATGASTGNGGTAQLAQTNTADAQLWSLQVQAPQPAAPSPDVADKEFAAWKAKYYNNGAISGEGFWGVAEIMEVVDDAYETTGQAKYRDMLADMYKSFLSKNGNDWMNNDYNDDITWAVLAFLRAGMLTGNQTYIAKAKQQYDEMFARAWTADFGGGLLWKMGAAGKMSCVNGPATVAAMYLAQATGDTTYYKKAHDIYEWSKLYLLVRSTGHVNDNYNGPGRVGASATTYNQGTYLGAAVMLYDHTRDTTYLNDAIKIADYTQNSMYRAGVINGESGGDLNGFKGILMRYARRYIVDLNHSDFIPWMQINAKAAYNNRNTTGMISTLWGTRNSEGTSPGAFSMSTAISLLFNSPIGTTVARNAYTTLEAEKFDYLKGITVTNTSDAGGGGQVGGIADGYFTAYMNVDFGASGAKSISARVASGTGGNIEVHQGSVSGPLLGTIPVPNTGDSNTFATASAPIASVTGLQNIYLVYKGTGSIGSLNNFVFSQNGAAIRTVSNIEPFSLRLNAMGTRLSVNLGGAFLGSITLSDLRGRILYRQGKTPSGLYSIDISAYPRGVYYFTAYSNGGSGRASISEKLVLQ